MDKVLKQLEEFSKGRKYLDDSYVDRLSNRYTTVILVVFAVVVTATMWVGEAIHCWAPVHFSKDAGHMKYMDSFCWVKNTYYLPFENEIPKEHEKHNYIPYYQWIPFILIAQAVLFYAPSVVWHGLNQKGGIDADNILHSAHTLNKSTKADKRESMLKLITNQMDRFLRMRLDTQGGFLRRLCSTCGRRFGSYLVILFLFSKILYLANVIFQLFILNRVLATDYNIYGFQVMEGLWRDHDWTDSPGVAFPRVTMCDFNIRRLGNLHRYTVQCTLPINLYNEKIYVFLWFWMVFIATVTALDFLVWLIRYCLRNDRLTFVLKHLPKERGKIEKTEIDEFVDNYLKQDGVFLLRLIIHNTNSATCVDIVDALFQKWTERKGKTNPPSRQPYDKAAEYDIDDNTDNKIPLKMMTS